MCPADFSWDELVRLLKNLGFQEIQGSGSRVKFYHQQRDRLIQLHKPHPAKILKRYMIKEILEILTGGQLI